MKMRMLQASIAAVLLALALPLVVGAQAPASQPPASAPNLTADQALPLTCAQAWIVAGKNQSSMLEIITMLAKVSLVNRALTFPNTRGAGLEAGRAIAADCKADPRALLFAIVDKHVRRVAQPGIN